MKKINLLPILALASSSIMAQEVKTNILWILTDDHRADALECYNKATRGTSESSLGYVSSPELDALAKEGTLFTRAYCNSAGSAPSRTSMHTGMYPHHRGVYGFEYYHDKVDYSPTSFPQHLAKQGYNTLGIGKLGVRWKTFENGKMKGEYPMYHNFLSNKYYDINGMTDLWKSTVWKEGDDKGSFYRYFYPDGTHKDYYFERDNIALTPQDHAAREELYAKHDIIVSDKGLAFQKKNPKRVANCIISGVSPQPSHLHKDGTVMREFDGFLSSEGKDYKTLAGPTIPGPKANQPQFLYLGHHFPHTPVLPSKSFHDQFKDKLYNLPAFDDEELSKMPPQTVKWYNATRANLFSEDEKQDIIRDYYAFAAMGDSIIGEEVRRFKKYCKDNNQEYLIVIGIGDHAWHLGEQGTYAKFHAFEQSTHTAVIVLGSDKKRYPEGKICNDYIEYVDFAPTFMAASGIDLSKKEYDYLDGYDLSDVISGKAPKREYVIGEIDAVCGPHAHIRTKDFMFVMRTRPNGRKVLPGDFNKQMRWAMDVSLEEADAALYDLRVDPKERNNVAYEKEYRKLAEWFRNKLGNIVLGDGRVECNWSKENVYQRSDFAIGSDDKKINIPNKIIP